MNVLYLYFERLSLLNSLTCLLPRLVGRRLRNQPVHCFYIDCTPPAQRIIEKLQQFINFSCEEIQFRLIDLQAEGRVSLRMRLPASDLFWFREKLKQFPRFRKAFRPEWDTGRVEDVLLKLASSRHLADDWRVPMRAIMVINVARQHMDKHQFTQSTLVLRKRPWAEIFLEYAQPLAIQIVFDPFEIQLVRWLKSNLQSILKQTLVKFPQPVVWYRKLKAIKPLLKTLGKPTETLNQQVPKVASFGRGHIHFENDGLNSDAFFCLQSKLSFENVIFGIQTGISDEEVQKADVVGAKLVYIGNHTRPELPTFWGMSQGDKGLPGPALKTLVSPFEFDFFHTGIAQYNWTKANYKQFFLKYNVKVNLDWSRYNEHHAIVGDAIREVGGISAIWQLALDVISGIELPTFSDIFFGFSNFGKELETKNGSRIPYFVVTGFQKDYLPGLLKEQAALVRQKLQKNGAKKIIAVFDEGSIADERWNYGHGLQRENYSYILEKVLETPWLGVIFKPKGPKNLHTRLGEVNVLLEQAIATGRCYVYRKKTGHGTTLVPPLLAALSADVVVHGHLGAGTAAFESALAGIPSLLIDREGWAWSKLYELGEGNVAFQDWPSCLEVILEYWKNPESCPNFGDWSPLLHEFDPFQDGCGAERMGNYIHSLLEGFKLGKDRDTVMADAAEQYVAQWGHDKIYSIV